MLENARREPCAYIMVHLILCSAMFMSFSGEQSVFGWILKVYVYAVIVYNAIINVSLVTL